MLINSLYDFSGLHNNQHNLQSRNNKFAAYQQTSSMPKNNGRQDVITISKEATLGRSLIENMANEFGQALVGRPTAIGENIKADEVKENYTQKLANLNGQLTSLLRQYNVSSSETISIVTSEDKSSLETEGSNYAVSQVEKMLKANPDITETITNLEHMSKFIHLSDLSSEYHKSYRQNPSENTYQSYEDMFSQVCEESYEIEYNNGELKGYNRTNKGNKIANWDVKTGYISSPL